MLASVWRQGWAARGWFAAYNAALLVSFLLALLVGRNQLNTTLGTGVGNTDLGMRSYWSHGFPPDSRVGMPAASRRSRSSVRTHPQVGVAHPVPSVVFSWFRPTSRASRKEARQPRRIVGRKPPHRPPLPPDGASSGWARRRRPTGTSRHRHPRSTVSPAASGAAPRTASGPPARATPGPSSGRRNTA